MTAIQPGRMAGWRSRLVVLLAALVTAAVTARLGVWQMDRAAQKKALQQSVDARRTMPAVSGAELARDAAAVPGQVHRQVELQGRWHPEATVFLENRQMQGRPGFFVVTPLVLDDGTAVMVQRGWLPRDPLDRTRVSAPALAEGRVQVSGRIAPPPSRLYEFDGAASGPIRQNLDVVTFAREFRLELRPLSVLQTAPQTAPQTPADDSLLRDWPAPAADVHKHHGYAAQWFALSALTIALYAWFQLLRPRLRRSR